LALTNGIVQFDSNVLGCSANSCWPYYLKSLAITTAIFLFVPSMFLHFLAPPLPQTDMEATTNGYDEVTISANKAFKGKSTAIMVYNELKEAQSDTPVSLLFSLNTMRNIHFLFLIFSYFAGISAGIFIITNNKNIWLSFTNGKDEDWAVQITTAFAVANTVANVISSWATDFLWNKFQLARNKLLAVILLFNAVIFAILTGLSYGISDPNQGQQIMFVICVVCVGFCFGNYLSLLPIIVGDFYGYVNFGIYFGYMQIGATAATFLLPNIAVPIKSDMGNYNIIFVLITIFLILAAAGVFLKRPTPIGRW